MSSQPRCRRFEWGHDRDDHAPARIRRAAQWVATMRIITRTARVRPTVAIATPPDHRSAGRDVDGISLTRRIRILTFCIWVLYSHLCLQRRQTRGCVRLIACVLVGGTDALGKWSALNESPRGRIFISYRRQETAWQPGGWMTCCWSISLPNRLMRKIRVIVRPGLSACLGVERDGLISTALQRTSGCPRRIAPLGAVSALQASMGSVS
jgi:hypothetical protein